MRFFFISVLLFFFIKPASLCAQNSFVRIYDIDGMAEYVQQTSDGGFIILTNSNDNFIHLLKTNSNGDSLWFKSYGISAPCWNRGYCVQQTSDDGFIISGSTSCDTSPNFDNKNTLIYLIRTNSIGDTLWTKKYDLTSLTDVAKSIRQTSDGNFIIIGDINYSLNGNADIILMKTDMNGDSIWTKIFGGTNHEFGFQVKETTDSGYVISGMESSMFNDIALFFKTDSDGNLIWTKNYGSNAVFDKCYDNGFIIGANTTNNDILLIKTNPNGDSLWSKKFGCSGYDEIFSVYQTNDDKFICLARNMNSCIVDTFNYLLKTNFWGDSLVAKPFPSNYNLRRLSLCQDNGFILAGAISSGNSTKVIIVKTDSLGNFPTSIENIKYFPITISIYPNPFSAIATVEIKNEKIKIVNAELKIIDIFGRTVKIISNIQTNEITITRDNLVDGIYFYQIIDKNKLIASGNFIIE